MFDSKQRDRIHEALLLRADDINTPRAKARILRRAAGDRRIFDRLIERKAAEFRRENPAASDGEIIKKIIDWLANGGLEQILKLVTTIIALFA